MQLPIPSLPSTPFGRVEHDDAKGIRDALSSRGVCVIKNVLSSEDISHCETLLWTWLEGHSDARRDDPTSWGSISITHTESGVMHGNGAGHTQLLWFIRTRATVLTTFSHIWGVDVNELVTSLDGCNLFRPWKLNPKWKTKGGWWHADLNPLAQRGLSYVQGFVSLKKADMSTGGLCVYETLKSWDTDKFRRDFGSLRRSSRFVRMPADHYILRDSHKGPFLVPCEPGDMILWDSRVVHCNTPGRHDALAIEADAGQYDMLRTIAYVCMIPRSRLTSRVASQRLDSFNDKTTCSHMPDIHRSFGKALSGTRARMPGLQRELTPVMKSLLGVD